MSIRKKIFEYLSNQIVSKWLILAMDMCIVILSFFLANFILGNLTFDKYTTESNKQLLVFTLVYFVSFIINSSYRGIIRHSGSKDSIKIIKATIVAFIILCLFNFSVVDKHISVNLLLPYQLLILHFILVTSILIGNKLLIKISIRTIIQGREVKMNTLIFGAGSLGMLTRDALEQEKNQKITILAFIDNNPTKIGKTINGVPIVSEETALDLSFYEKNNVDQLIIAIENLDPLKKKRIIEVCINMKVTLKEVPSIDKWINGHFSFKQLRNIKIEDLLERDSINLYDENINQILSNKTILVTGAAGSIGSEICRQVLKCQVSKLILIDQAESDLYNLQQEFILQKTIDSGKVKFYVANIKDYNRMNNIFDRFRPQIIFHAAAYKHVPLMEKHPYEAIMVNYFGTKLLADLAIKYNVERFVMISSDKAVNPTNVMGATKRLAEIYIQSQNNNTKFITTRFGNVLGSNGSVIPLFEKQIKKGGPVTLTHKEITRYFMTIPEACNLVLEAGAMGNGADIFIFDMGKSIKIYDLAVKMITLSGLEVGRDIEIVETGLRPGEKLYEELLNSKENTIETHHPKILRAKVSPYSRKDVEKFTEELSSLMLQNDDQLLVKKIKEFIPEYQSNNSIFEVLDTNNLI